MLKSIQQRDLDRNRWIKISMGVILVLICVSMVVTLVPGLMSGSFGGGTRPDAVATVGGQDITVADVERQLDADTRGQTIPEMMRRLYTKQVLDEMVFQRALYVEADRLGIRVTDEEETDEIKQIFPDAWSGGVWQKDRYVSEVEARGMSVPDFETSLRDEMLQQKFREMVTDGITVTPAEIQQQWQWQNERVKIDYVVVKPADLASTINPTDAELAAYFAANSTKYQVPEKRSARYAMLDLAKLRANTHVSDDEMRAYYNAHLDQYKVENRVHVEHILFKTIGKTDAEVAEIRQKAEDVLKQAKHGANFEDLAKKYSEDDTSKPKGGDLGWIVEGQTVPEFQQAAFSQPVGSISDLVQTQYGFHIIKVLDRQTARTKSFEEVRDSIQPILLDQKVNQEADAISGQMAEAVRQSDRQPIEDVAKKFDLEVGEIPPVSFTEPLGPLGNSQDLHQALFQLNRGELSDPIRLDSGWVILTVKDILPAHQGTLAEVHDRVLADYRQEKSLTLAQGKAEELAKRAQGGEAFDKAAKELGLEVKSSNPFARNDSVPDVGAAQQIDAAFNMQVGQVSGPVETGGNWLVYRVADHNTPDLATFAKQQKDVEDQLLETKKDAAFEAFRNALEDRLKQEGKFTINTEALNRLTNTSS